MGQNLLETLDGDVWNGKASSNKVLRLELCEGLSVELCF